MEFFNIKSYLEMNLAERQRWIHGVDFIGTGFKKGGVEGFLFEPKVRSKGGSNMKVYLMQHGKPVPKEENPERPLSRQGQDEVNRMGQMLKACGISISQALHSGKKRAQETAEIMLKNLNPGAKLIKKDNISPMDDPSAIASEIPNLPDGTLIVGHLPHMGKLVSLLVTGSQDQGVVQFQQGGMVCVERPEGGTVWVIRWMLVPELLPAS